ncbi:hypothetical protein [Psychrobacter sp. I-STPA10]|uniref:hypothetical protein n=1 Tax=Psychrobacter sp. I-STPA10 TaxID=2585769 RepID=UPI001E3D505E|nr:hypothetical protein [Psychrobacter sp. I-STPA10]
MINKLATTIGSIGLGILLSTPTYAANYNDFLSPNSLGQNINTLNTRYGLGLKKQDWGAYQNSDAYNCSLTVKANSHNKITSIQVAPNNDKCTIKTTSSGINYHHGNTKIVDILNQVRLEDIQFIPACFNCPSRLELPDSLVVMRPQDPYYTEFNIDGYNTPYTEFLAQKVLGNFDLKSDIYYKKMSEMDEKFNLATNNFEHKDISLLKKKEIRLKAIHTYDLQSTPWRYEIGLK